MTDPINEQISAFVDGELSSAESELLMKRFQRDEPLRETVGRYSLIGEALRSTEAGGPSKDFAARVSRAIEQEESPGRSWRPVANWLKPVAGGAIAAGVAAVALVSLRIAPINGSAGSMEAAIETPSMPVLVDTGVRQIEKLPSDTVPVSNGNFTAPPIQVMNNGRLANFVMAHSEYSTPLARRNVLTSLLAEETIEQNNGTPPSEFASRPTSLSTSESVSESVSESSTRGLSSEPAAVQIEAKKKSSKGSATRQ